MPGTRFRDEWRSQRGARVAIAILAFLAPIAGLAGGSLRRVGVPIPDFPVHSADDVLGTLVPLALVVVLWPAAALVSGWIAFLPGDAALWSSRARASAYTVAGAIVLTGLAAVGLSAGFHSALADLVRGAAFGLALACLAWSAGAAGAKLARARSASFTAALALFAAAVTIPWFLWRSFPEAAATVGRGHRDVHAAVIVPLVFGPGLVFVSTRHGRRSAFGALAFVCLLSSGAFAAGAEGAVRWEFRWLRRDHEFGAAPAGHGLLQSGSLHDEFAAQLYDAATGRRVRWFSPDVSAAAWTPDGAVLAIATNAGWFGARRETYRVLWVAEDGSSSSPASPLPVGVVPLQVKWSGGRLVVATAHDKRPPRPDRGVYIVDPADGRTTAVELGPWSSEAILVGPSEDGTVFVSARRAGAPAHDWTVRALDPNSGTLGTPEAVSRRLGPVLRLDVSPRKDFWLLVETDHVRSEDVGVIVDARTGATVGESGRRHAAWLRDGSLLWVDRRDDRWSLVHERPGRGAARVATRSPSLSFDLSPDRRRALVHSAVYEVFEPDTGRWIALPIPARIDTWHLVYWAGAKTLVFWGLDFIVLADVDDLNDRRVIYGIDPF